MNRNLTLCFIAAATLAVAQEQHKLETFERRVEILPHSGAMSGNVMYRQEGAPGVETIQFISAEIGAPGRLVKGAPYTADAVSETVQTLADGNRIARKTTSRLARDSEGRTRRQDTLGGIGPWPAGEAHELVFITDPVAKLSWVLETRGKVARKMPLPPVEPREGAQAVLRHDGGEKLAEHMIQLERRRVEAESAQARVDARAPKTEPLGKRNIEGVIAEGTRSTITLPPGAIGNDRAIDIVSERWYSPELQTTVMTRRNDPRTGETTYRLTNIQRAEPPRSLFEPPADYQVKDVKGDVKIRLEEKR